MTRFKGDDMISGSDTHLWSLCYSTLERFACLVMFKVRGPDVRIRLDKHITFFVPGTHERAVEVKAYLEEELRSEIMASGKIGDEFTYGTQVRVEFFSGVQGYLTREETEPLIEKAMASFYEMLEARTRKPS